MRKKIVYGVGGYDPSKPNNNVIEEVEIVDTPQRPLNSVGVLATLLAVNNVLSLEDAANAVGKKPDVLITEAQAWAAAQSLLDNLDGGV